MIKKILFFTLLLIFFISSIFMLFFVSGYSNILDDSQYIKSLNKSGFLKTVMKNIEIKSGLYNLYKIDRQLYFVITNYIKKSIKDVYIKKIIKKWTDFLKGKNPIVHTLDFTKLRSSIFWIIKKRIEQSKKIPDFIKTKAYKFLKKKFKRVPTKINIFKNFKIRKNMIRKINNLGFLFSKIYEIRLLIIIIPVLLVILIFLIKIDKKVILYQFSFWGIILSGTLLLTLHVFGSKSINLALEVISYHKSISNHIIYLISNLISQMLSDIKTVLTISFFTISIPVILDLFEKKKVSTDIQ